MTTCWMNGTLLKDGVVEISALDRGLLLGDGVFDTMAWKDGEPLQPDMHLMRLRHDAGTLQIPLPYDDKTLVEAARAVLKGNRLQEGAAVVRVTVTRGAGTRGLLPPEMPAPTVLITVSPMAGIPGPASVIVAGARRNESSLLGRIKSLNYLDNILARMEAAAKGADDALMLNAKGRVACASAANVFVVIDDLVLTPSRDEGALPGVVRNCILSHARDIGLAVQEGNLEQSRLFEADEIFLTNSLIGVRPVIKINKEPVSNNEIGPVTQRLKDLMIRRQAIVT